MNTPEAAISAVPKSSLLARPLRLVFIPLFIVLVCAQTTLACPPQSDQSQDLAQQIFDTMMKTGGKPGYRAAHAKGLVVTGTFTATPAAAQLSSAAHFRGGKIPVTVRFSDGAPDPSIPDNSPNAYPRGIAIRFTLPGGDTTDIMGVSHNGFIVGSGEDFLALVKSIAATDPSKPHPWPVEQFLGSHPRALKFVQDGKPTPTSFATAAFYANNAVVFVGKKGARQPVRYQIVPTAGIHLLDDADAAKQPANFLFDELRAHLAKEPVTYRLIAQLPNPGDPTNDGSLVWPDDRKTVDLGTITLNAVAPDTEALSKALAFDPTLLTDGIELSDDPLPDIRSRVYGFSAMQR